MNNIRLLFTSSLLILLSGCVVVNGESGWHDSHWQKEQRKNREAIAELQIGMERSQVVSRLGVPEFSEAFTRDGEEFRVLFFRTRHRHSDGETSRDETTPLIFRNDTLIGWGDDVLASIR